MQVNLWMFLMFYISRRIQMTYTQPLTHETLLTVHELANLLKIKPDTIYHWNLRKAYPEIKRVKIAGKVYFKLSSLQPFLGAEMS